MGGHRLQSILSLAVGAVCNIVLLSVKEEITFTFSGELLYT